MAILMNLRHPHSGENRQFYGRPIQVVYSSADQDGVAPVEATFGFWDSEQARRDGAPRIEALDMVVDGLCDVRETGPYQAAYVVLKNIDPLGSAGLEKQRLEDRIAKADAEVEKAQRRLAATEDPDTIEAAPGEGEMDPAEIAELRRAALTEAQARRAALDSEVEAFGRTYDEARTLRGAIRQGEDV